MKKVFISYSRSDYPFAHQLVEHLKSSSGVSGWMDSADIPAGYAVADDVRSALRESSAVMVLVSPHSLRSQWVNFEIGASVSLGLPVIPIIIGGEALEHDLPELLQGRTFLDARNRPMSEVALDVEKELRLMPGVLESGT